MRTSVVVLGLMTTFVVCGCGGSPTCAPAGTYQGSVVRNAIDPGTCPVSLQLSDLGWKIQDETIKAHQFCGEETEELSGTSGTCSHKGTATYTATSTGITGIAKFTVDCPKLGASNCTANFDLIYTLQ